jgi:hypothetical protein
MRWKQTNPKLGGLVHIHGQLVLKVACSNWLNFVFFWVTDVLVIFEPNDSPASWQEFDVSA